MSYRHPWILLAVFFLLCIILYLCTCPSYETFESSSSYPEQNPSLINGVFKDSTENVTYYMSGTLVPGNLNQISGQPSYLGITYYIQINWSVNGINYSIGSTWNPFTLGTTWTSTLSSKSSTSTFVVPYSVTVTVTSTSLKLQFPSNATGIGSLTKNATKSSDTLSVTNATPTVIPYLKETWEYPYRFRNTAIETAALGPAYMACGSALSNGTCAEASITCTMNPHYRVTQAGRTLPNCKLWSYNWGSAVSTMFNGIANQIGTTPMPTCTYPATTSQTVTILNQQLKKSLTLVPNHGSGLLVWANPSPTDKVSSPPPTNSSEYINRNPMDHDLYSTFDASVTAPTSWTIEPVTGVRTQCIVMLRSGSYYLKVSGNGTLEVTTYGDGLEQYFIWNQMNSTTVILSPMIMPNLMIGHDQNPGYLPNSIVAECVATSTTPIRGQLTITVNT